MTHCLGRPRRLCLLMVCLALSGFSGPVAQTGVKPKALRPVVSPAGNVDEFPPVETRKVRFVILETNGGPPGLDELEIFTAEADPRNVALRDAGAVASASGSEIIPPIHDLRNLNDGHYGNDFSWIATWASDKSSARQWIDVTPSATAIDSGETAATLSGLLGGWETQDDSMVVEARFLDADRRKLGNPLVIGPVTALDRTNHTLLLPRTGRQTVPRGTRTIEVEMIAERRPGGEFNDGYADNLSLMLGGPATSPVSGLGTNLLKNPDAEVDLPSARREEPIAWTRTGGGFTVFPVAAPDFEGKLRADPDMGRNLFVGGPPPASNEWWVQINLPQPTRISKVVWSRDRTGHYVTRTPIRYRIEVALGPDDWEIVASSEDREPYPNLIPMPPPPAGLASLSHTVESWDQGDGLPSNAVNELAQTPEGYLWISTDQGLARFDGFEFKVFTGANAPALGTVSFGSLFTDPSGRLWIQRKVPREEPNNLAVYERGTFAGVDTRGHRVHFVRVDDRGTPWLFCEDGVFPWREGGLDPDGKLASVDSSQPLSTFLGPENALWIANGARVGVVANGRWTVVTGTNGLPLNLGEPETHRGATYPGGHGWIGSGGLSAGGWRDFGTNLLRQVLPGGRLSDPLPLPWRARSFALIDVAETPTGDLWLAAGQPDYGLYRLAPEVYSYERYASAQGLTDLNFTATLVDRAGNLWVGTRHGGLNRLRRKLFQTEGHLPNGAPLEVATIAPSRSGGVWFCAKEQAIYRWHQGRMARLFSDTAPHAAVLEDSDGGIWTAGEWLGGRRNVERRWTEMLTPLSREFDSTTVLFEDRLGRVWLGGPYGLAIYDHGKTVRETLRQPDGSRPGAVQCFTEAADGAIWIGTQSGRLHRFADGRFSVVWSPAAASSAPVCALWFDRTGALWLARPGQGISRWSGGVMTHYTPAQGLPSASISGMVEDKKGFVWMSSRDGVFRISEDDLAAFAAGDVNRTHWRHFTKKDGLPSLECVGEASQPGMCRDTDGRIWVATVRGVAWVDPETLTTPSPPAAILQTAEYLGSDKQVHPLLTDGEFLHHAGAEPLEVTVPPGPNNLLIHYTGVDLDDPGLVTFRYRLQGLNPDWVDVKAVRSAVFPSLGPGAYHFELAARNKSGANSAIARLDLRVLPFWWETRLFQGVLIGLLVAVGPLIYFFRVRWLKHRHQVQVAFSRQLIQREEDERKRVAQQVHDVLGHELLLLKNAAAQGEQRAEPGNPLAGQFGQISSIASRALQESREIAHRLRPIELDRLGLTQALETLLDATAASSGLRVFREIDDVGSLLPAELQVHLYRLVQEGLNNILKHARATTVMFELQRDDNRVRLHLGDDGVGFDTAAAEGRHGLGLTGMEERVRLVGGEFEITSAPGAGTHLRIRFPAAGAVNGKDG